MMRTATNSRNSQVSEVEAASEKTTGDGFASGDWATGRLGKARRGDHHLAPRKRHPARPAHCQSKQQSGWIGGLLHPLSHCHTEAGRVA